MKQILLLTCMLFLSFGAFAQSGSITGNISDNDTYEALPRANVVIKGTSRGTTTDINGKFTLSDLSPGSYALEISFIGYQLKEMIANVRSGQTTNLGEIRLGAASINVRGFDQRNTAVMINGVPVNDMENGWVYWSNWAGLSDVTTKMQVQRGLGASKLAVPTIGGSINIITNAADMRKGGAFGAMVGNDGYNKYSLVLSTGLGFHDPGHTHAGQRVCRWHQIQRMVLFCIVIKSD